MKFGDFVEINPRVRLDRNAVYPCVMMDEVNPGIKYVSGNHVKLPKGGAKFETNDTIFARITPCLENGKIAKYSGKYGEVGFGSTEFFVFREKPDISFHDFIFYLSLTDEIRKPAESSMFGASGRQRADLKAIQDIDIDPPPIDTQRKIASILTAYDDLIENNTRRIAILEEMAQRIYREWFVHFRYPGHEQDELVESELGLIPGGWEVITFGDSLQFNIGGGWGKDELLDSHSEPGYVIRGTDIPRVKNGDIDTCPLRFHTASNIRSRIIQPHDIVFEVSGGSKDQPLGRSIVLNEILINRFDYPIICASFCKLIRPNQEVLPSVYLQEHFSYIYETKEIMKYQVQSTGISNFKFTTFMDQHQIVKPKKRVLEQYKRTITAIYDQICFLGQIDSNLRQTRDLLLPKLISGRIDVSELNINLGEIE